MKKLFNIVALTFIFVVLIYGIGQTAPIGISASASSNPKSKHKVWYTHHYIAPPGGVLGWILGVPDATTYAEAQAGANPVATDGPYTNDKVYASWLTGSVSTRSWYAEQTDTDGGGSQGHGKSEFTGNPVDNLGVTISDVAIGLVFGIEGKCELWADAKNDDGKTGARGYASLDDPFHFEGLPIDVDPFLITSSLEAGTSFSSIGNGSSGSFYSEGWTNIPGLEGLYTLDITTVESPSITDPFELDVQFWSNPIFGLDDSYIESQIKSAFYYNPLTLERELTSDLEYFSVELTPSSLSSFTLGFNDEASAAVVPEPSTMLLFGFGFLGLLGVGAIKKRGWKG